MSIRPNTPPRATHACLSTLRIVLVGLLVSTAALTAEDERAGSICAFDPAWITKPASAEEVGFSEDDGKDSSFCDFYEFSWQNFLYLVSPVAGSKAEQGNAYEANFLDSKQYLPYTSDTNPCAGTSPKQTFFGTMPTGLEPRDWKSLDDPDIYQAGSRAVIYDRNGNPAIYSTRFSRNLCDVREVVNHSYFPAGTTELKMVWRILTPEDDASLYYTVGAPPGALGADTEATTLGLIGFHGAIATAAHPEMIWFTVEHNLNNPQCSGDDPFHAEALADQPYSFTSAECAEDPGRCFFNEPRKFKRNEKAPVEGQLTEICQVYPYGQLPDTLDPGDNDNKANQEAIETLYSGFLTANKNPEPWSAVWSNYRMIGALWLSQPYDANADELNSSNYVAGAPCPGTAQRGSLALANTVAETDFQGPLEESIVRNCFGCHQFTTNSTRYLRPIRRVDDSLEDEIEEEPYPTRGTGTISHIFGNIFKDNCRGLNFFNANVKADPTDPVSVATGCKEVCTWRSTGNVWTGKFNYSGDRLACNCCIPAPVASH